MSGNLKKNIRKTSAYNSIMIFLFIIFILGISLLSSFVYSNLPDSHPLKISSLYTLILYIIQYVVLIPLLIILFYKTKHGKAAPKLKDCICKPKMPVSQIIKWLFISLFFVYAASFISNIFFNIIQMLTNIEMHPAQINADNSLLNIFTNTLSIMFFAPIFEEAFFRGTLLRNSARYGSWSMIIAMGIMFGLWHINYAQTIYTAALGICAGFLIIKSGSIVPSLLLHFIMNTIGTVQVFISGSIDAEKLASMDLNYMTENIIPIMISSMMGFLIIGIMITGLVLLIIELAMHHLDGFKLPYEYTEMSEKKKFAIYFSSPITIVITLGLIGLTIYNALTL